MDKRISRETEREKMLPQSPALFRYDLQSGPGEQQTEEYRRIFGSNVLTKRKKAGFLRQFIGNFSDPIIRILQVGS